jgi:hypothetical protein
MSRNSNALKAMQMTALLLRLRDSVERWGVLDPFRFVVISVAAG